ncbi:site-specific integrase [Actinospongicola halichondriae]|uniref:site-specific integrase n=1 Tax=Actinospongicola halichondriae TaxID=3236844 RepID=UPI003D48A9ED
MRRPLPSSRSVTRRLTKQATRETAPEFGATSALEPDPSQHRRRYDRRRGLEDHLDAEQLSAFLQHVAENRYLTPWLFLATTGCRRGECLGLKWSDLDLDEVTAVISRQVTAVDHEVIVKDLPKTKQGHMIVLDSETVAMLRRWRATQNEEKLLVGPGYVEEGYVFCKPDGTVYDPDRFSREFIRKQERYNRDQVGQPLARLTLHGLRRTWATLALHEGIDIKIVSDRLHHSSTFITLEIYTHVTPPMQSDAAERVASRIFSR